MKRVLVIGGRGYLGSNFVRALCRLQDVEVCIGSRRARESRDIIFDFNDPATYANASPFDFIINCTDSFAAPPMQFANELARWKTTFIETTAATEVYRKLLQSLRRRVDLSAAIVLGVGIFPGLSNLLAADFMRRHPTTREIHLAVRWSLLSGAGTGTSRMMSRLMKGKSYRYVDGQEVIEPPFGEVRAFRFFPGERYWALRSGFTEAILLNHSLGVGTTAAYAAFVPPMPKIAMEMASIPALTAIGGLPPVNALLTAQFSIVRGMVLRGKTTPVQMSVTNEYGAVFSTLQAAEGMMAAGYAGAALVDILRGRPPLPGGIYTIDQLTTLGDEVDRMKRLGFTGISTSVL